MPQTSEFIRIEFQDPSGNLGGATLILERPTVPQAQDLYARYGQNKVEMARALIYNHFYQFYDYRDSFEKSRIDDALQTDPNSQRVGNIFMEVATRIEDILSEYKITDIAPHYI